MLGKMLVHGFAAAILIGSAATVYAQARDNGTLSPDAPVPAVAGKADDRDHDRRDRHHDDD